MTDKQRAQRTPRNFDSILKGALSLTLKERVDLVNAVSAANKAEVELKQQEAAEAAGLVNLSEGYAQHRATTY